MTPPATAPALWTYAEYRALPEDGKRYQLFDGDLVLTPAPTTRHQRVAAWLTHLMMAHVEENGLGLVLPAPTDVVFSDLDVMQPDLLFVAAAHADRVHEEAVIGAPDLVVEILSPTSRRQDEITKRKLYESAGVPEYWVLDPELDAAKVYRRNPEGVYYRALETSVEEEGHLDTPLLPGLRLPLARLFPAR